MIEFKSYNWPPIQKYNKTSNKEIVESLLLEKTTKELQDEHFFLKVILKTFDKNCDETCFKNLCIINRLLELEIQIRQKNESTTARRILESNGTESNFC